MNQFFNFNRFSLLVAKHWADNKKRYLLSVIAFIGLLIAWFVFTILVDSRFPMGTGIQMVTFFFSLFVVGSFYANQYFRDLGSRAKGINFLLVPASAFEKILCSLLFTVILFFIVFTTAFYLVDIIMVSIAKNFQTIDVPDKDKGIVNVFESARLPLDGKSTLNILLVFFSIQSVFLLGSVYFEKYSFIKTIICGFVVFFIVFFFVYFLYDMMPEGGYVNHFLTSYHVNNKGKGDDYLVRIPVWIGQILYYMLMYGVAPFFWIVTYFRLKEKQV
jgi:hypothetical protein